MCGFLEYLSTLDIIFEGVSPFPFFMKGTVSCVPGATSVVPGYTFTLSFVQWKKVPPDENELVCQNDKTGTTENTTNTGIVLVFIK